MKIWKMDYSYWYKKHLKSFDLLGFGLIHV